MVHDVFDITPHDIAQLDDGQLRELIARLCEAEVRSQGFSTVSVSAGGHQDAADAGIDVRVALPQGSAIGGFIPRAATGFQVKKSEMPPKEIADEMRPKDILRQSIRALASQAGAYIIASSGASTTDSQLTSRLDAMRSVLSDESNADRLALDFYGQRDHLL